MSDSDILDRIEELAGGVSSTDDYMWFADEVLALIERRVWA